MFTAVLFLRAQKWKQPKCLSTDKWINSYDGLFSHKKECYNVDEPRKHGNQRKPVTKDHLSYDSI